MFRFAPLFYSHVLLFLFDVHYVFVSFFSYIMYCFIPFLLYYILCMYQFWCIIFYITQFRFFIKNLLFFILSKNYNISLHQLKYMHFHTILYTYAFFYVVIFYSYIITLFLHCIIIIGILYYYITLSHVFLSKLPTYIFII